jgi:hypothetical protein
MLRRKPTELSTVAAITGVHFDAIHVPQDTGRKDTGRKDTGTKAH